MFFVRICEMRCSSAKSNSGSSVFAFGLTIMDSAMEPRLHVAYDVSSEYSLISVQLPVRIPLNIARCFLGSLTQYVASTRPVRSTPSTTSHTFAPPRIGVFQGARRSPGARSSARVSTPPPPPSASVAPPAST